jgi:predicted dehydrogenase
MRYLALLAALYTLAASPVLAQTPPAPKPVRIAIAGLAHGHLGRIVRLIKANPNVELVGLQDADPKLNALMAERYGLSKSLFHTSLDGMLDATRPEGVAGFGTTFDHKAVVEAAARRGIHVMVEKPLAVSLADARAIQAAAAKGKIHVLVNYETTWYASHAKLWALVKEQKVAGDIRKMVAMDGHQGPKEIGVGDEFFSWLTDPVLNGAGALYDFGCYGANLMTWLMDQRPVAVTARVQQFKPHIYPKVDDEATILVEYPKAQGIIEASWNWPFNRKDLEVYGESGYAVATGPDSLRVRVPKRGEQASVLDPLPPSMQDELAYFAGVIRGTVKPSGLSSLENNMIATEILEAARESARTGRTVRLSGL